MSFRSLLGPSGDAYIFVLAYICLDSFDYFDKNAAFIFFGNEITAAQIGFNVKINVTLGFYVERNMLLHHVIVKNQNICLRSPWNGLHHQA